MDRVEAADLLEKAPSIAARQRTGTVIIDTLELFQVLDPDRPFPGSNTISRTNFDESGADEGISAAIARYRARSLPFCWYVFPSSRPKDLAERLGSRGPSQVVPSFGFAAGCAIVLPLRVPDVALEPLSAANLDEYAMTESESFADVRPLPVDEARASAAKKLSSREPDFLSFLARWEGEPAGFCSMRLVRDGRKAAGMLTGAGVRPSFRRRGVMRAMIKHRAEEMLRRGVGTAMVYAHAATSAPIYRKLGFEEIFRFPIFLFSPAAS